MTETALTVWFADWRGLQFRAQANLADWELTDYSVLWESRHDKTIWVAGDGSATWWNP